MKWEQGTKYYCLTCETKKWLPENPEHPARRPRTGCENCGITQHKPVGIRQWC